MCMCVFSHVRVRAHVCQCISVCVAIAQHNYQGGVSSFLLPNECWAHHSSPQLWQVPYRRKPSGQPNDNYEKEPIITG